MPGQDIADRPPEGIRETPVGHRGFLAHPGWADSLPWLVQGTTTRGDAPAPFDLGLFADASPPRRVMTHWHELRSQLGFPRAVHAHQVHGADVRFHGSGPEGLHVGPPCDGHVTATPGVLLAVTTADCVPVFVVDPGQRAVALLHAGWRGAAAGVLERGLQVLRSEASSKPSVLRVHMGPAICGACYEVGPEVFAALGLPAPDGPTPLDLRAALAERALRAGVLPEHVTISEHCTRCTGSGLFSHRGGDRERQVGYLGIRP